MQGLRRDGCSGRLMVLDDNGRRALHFGVNVNVVRPEVPFDDQLVLLLVSCGHHIKVAYYSCLFSIQNTYKLLMTTPVVGPFLR